MNDNQKVLIQTTLGDIEVELFTKESPITTENFVKYIKDDFFSGTIFHRVIPNFMVQGGGFDVEMKQKKSMSPIQNEAKNGVENKRGTLAMARTSDPHSASNQFFINLTDNGFLNQQGERWGYAVFGKVSKGMEVVDSIAEVKTGSHGFHDDVPLQPIVIQAVSLIS